MSYIIIMKNKNKCIYEAFYVFCVSHRGTDFWVVTDLVGNAKLHLESNLGNILFYSILVTRTYKSNVYIIACN